MPAMSMGFGAALIVIGLVGYLMTGAESLTALIPAVLGLVLVICGVIAARSEQARPHAMHAALVVALLGVLGSGPMLTDLPAAIAGDADRPVATYSSTATVVLMIVFIALGVRSFIAARKAREAGSA